jgi:hypothetical protein
MKSTFPAAMNSSRSRPSARSKNLAQYGHWKSPNSSIRTGASGSPMTRQESGSGFDTVGVRASAVASGGGSVYASAGNPVSAVGVVEGDGAAVNSAAGGRAAGRETRTSATPLVPHSMHRMHPAAAERKRIQGRTDRRPRGSVIFTSGKTCGFFDRLCVPKRKNSPFVSPLMYHIKAPDNSERSEGWKLQPDGSRPAARRKPFIRR